MRTLMQTCRFGLAALVLAAASAAHAETWTDPQNRFSFDLPAGWPAERPVDRGAATELVIGAADYECWFYYVPRPETASAEPAGFARANAAPLSAESWAASTRPFRPMEPSGGQLAAPTVSGMAVDTSKFFPLHRATIMNGSKRIMAAMAPRPGAEIWTMCLSYDATDRTATFEQVIASLSTPRDAAMAEAGAAAAAASEAARQAAAAAAQQQTQQPAEQPAENRRRGGRGLPGDRGR